MGLRSFEQGKVSVVYGYAGAGYEFMDIVHLYKTPVARVFEWDMLQPYTWQTDPFMHCDNQGLNIYEKVVIGVKNFWEYANSITDPALSNFMQRIRLCCERYPNLMWRIDYGDGWGLRRWEVLARRLEPQFVYGQFRWSQPPALPI